MIRFMKAEKEGTAAISSTALVIAAVKAKC